MRALSVFAGLISAAFGAFLILMLPCFATLMDPDVQGAARESTIWGKVTSDGWFSIGIVFLVAGIWLAISKPRPHTQPLAAADPIAAVPVGSNISSRTISKVDTRSGGGNMARLLFVVEDRFLIKGRGLVPVPGIVPQGEERFRIGDPLLIQRPDGSSLECKIDGLEMFLDRSPSLKNEVFLLLEGLSKDDVPIGSEVWSVAFC